MALFQYTFDFYHSCAKHSNIDEVLIEFASNDLKSVRVADSFKEVSFHYKIEYFLSKKDNQNFEILRWDQGSSETTKNEQTLAVHFT